MITLLTVARLYAGAGETGSFPAGVVEILAQVGLEPIKHAIAGLLRAATSFGSSSHNPKDDTSISSGKA